MVYHRGDAHFSGSCRKQESGVFVGVFAMVMRYKEKLRMCRCSKYNINYQFSLLLQ